MTNNFRSPANFKTHISSMRFKLVNLGLESEPKYVSLGKCCSPGERKKFIRLFKQYKDIFSWTYENMKMYDTRIIPHVVPIKVGVNPFQHSLRKMHSKLEPLIQNEVKKMLDARIIFQSQTLRMGFKFSTSEEKFW